MARGEKIVITIGKDGGGIKIEAEGFKGEACSLATRDIAKALGTVESDTPTAEMYETPVMQEQEAHA